MEPNQSLFNLIERDRSWLAIQPRFETGWIHGCRWVLGEIENWVRTAGTDLLHAPVDGDLLDRCCARVWAAWSYHWHEAASASSDCRADGASVAALLRKGIRPGKITVPLGGDPIRDSVLVEACLLGQATAHDRLREAYADVFLREVRRVGAASEARLLEEEVWDRLDPIDEASRRWLGRYCGYSSLRTFLRVAVRHRLVDSLRRQNTRRLAERMFTERRHTRAESLTTPDAELEEFHAQVKEALQRLPDVERRVLILRYREGLPNGVVASRIGLSGGQTSRLHHQAVERLRSALKPLWQDEIGSSEQAVSLYAQFLLRGISETLSLRDYSGEAESATRPKEGPMGLIQHLEKPKETRRTALKPAPATRKPVAPREELPRPAPPPLDLEGLIPETIAAVVLGEIKPETAFAELRGIGAEERPGAICVDARGSMPKDIRTWLDKFDAFIYEQDEAAAPDPIEMQVVVFLPANQSLEPFDDLLTRPDIDWVLTDDRRSPLKDLYRDVVRKDLTALLSTDPTRGFHQEDDPDFRPVEEFLPEDEREEWKQRLQELGRKED